MRDNLRALMLIRAYRVRGHLIANLDPLGLDSREHHPELDPATYGFTDADYDREFFIDGVLGRETASLREILEVLKQVYCDRIGIEFMHIQHPDEKAWLQRRVENSLNRTRFSRERKLDILRELERAEGLERFLHGQISGDQKVLHRRGRKPRAGAGGDHTNLRRPRRRGKSSSECRTAGASTC